MFRMPLSDERRAAMLAEIERLETERKSFEPGESLLWYREFRNDPGWYSRVTFVRYAGKTKSLIRDSGDIERRVPTEKLSRQR